MRFDATLIPATLLKRYKRFLADVRCEGGSVITVHCPNSGSMLGLNMPGSPVLLSRSPNPKRKYPHTLEMVHADGVWVGVNTARANDLVYEGLEQGIINNFGLVKTRFSGFSRHHLKELQGTVRPHRGCCDADNNFGTLRKIRREVRVSEKSRLDFALELEGGNCFLEVKNCTLAQDGVAMFPDAITSRGTKHLEELLLLKQAGHGAAVLFCVQREDTRLFRPAAHIDPQYADTLARVSRQGVMVCAYQARVTPDAVTISAQLPVAIPPA